MVLSFRVLIWPNLPSYDLVPCHLLFHSVPGCVAYGRLIILPKEVQPGQESRQPPATLEREHSPFLRIWKIAAQQYAFKRASKRLQRTLLSLSCCEEKNSQPNSILPSATIPLLFMPCNIKSAQDPLVSHSWQCPGPRVFTGHCDHWLWVKPLKD